MKVYLTQCSPNIGDLRGNLNLMKQEVLLASQQGADVVVFPELITVGYPPRDLLYDRDIWNSHDNLIRDFTNFVNAQNKQITAIFGGLHQVARTYGQYSRYNAAYIIDKKYGVRIVHKKLLPCYNEFYENRYFEPGQDKPIPLPVVATDGDGKQEIIYCDVIICEDMWNFRNTGTVPGMSPGSYSVDPVAELAGEGPIFIINASPFWYKKINKTIEIVENISRSLKRHVVWCNQVGGFDDLIFGGYSMFVQAPDIDNSETRIHVCRLFGEDRVLAEISNDGWIYIRQSNSSFSETAMQNLENKPPVYGGASRGALRYVESVDFDDWCILAALRLGLSDYCKRTGFKKIVFGCSGGIDSALVGAIACEALGSENVTGITMPSKFSSEGSWKDSEELAQNLGMELIHWNIKNIHQEMRYVALDGSPTFQFGITDENIMPRIRATLLMAFSNDNAALLVSTGNKSELSVGYFSAFGDSVGFYALLLDVYKTKVYRLCELINRYNGTIIPENITTKAPSAELKDNQKDTDSLPPYDILDGILLDLVENEMSVTDLMRKHQDASVVNKVVNLYNKAEFKRKICCMGPKITYRAFGSGRNMPICMKRSLI